MWEQHDAGRWKAAYLAIPLSARREFERDGHQRFFVELDKCHGSCLLTKCHSTVASALEFFHGSRVWTGDYVVMPNHVHVVVQPFPGVKLEDWLYSVKRFTSTQILKDASVATLEMVESRNVWQTESFDRVVRDRDELARTRRYIRNNPGKLKPGTFALKQMDWLDAFVGKP